MADATAREHSGIRINGFEYSTPKDTPGKLTVNDSDDAIKRPPSRLLNWLENPSIEIVSFEIVQVFESANLTRTIQE